MVDKVENVEGIKWNILEYHGYTLAQFLKEAMQFYLDGDLYNWFFRLTAVRELINFHFKPDERTLLDDYEKKIYTLVPVWKKYWGSKKNYEKIDSEILKDKAEFFKAIQTYQRCLMDKLKKYKYFPTMKDERYLGNQ